MSILNKNLVISAGLACALALGACSTSSETKTTTTVSDGESTVTQTTTTSTDESGSTTTETTTTSSTAGGEEWTNEYFNIAFVPPAGWTILDAASGPTVDSNLAALSADMKPIMVATPNDGTSNGVIIAREDPSAETADITAEARVKAIAEEDKKAIEGAGLKFEASDGTLSIGTDQLPASEYKMTASDGTVSYCLQGVKKTSEGDFLTIVVMGDSEDALTNNVSLLKQMK